MPTEGAVALDPSHPGASAKDPEPAISEGAAALDPSHPAEDPKTAALDPSHPTSTDGDVETFVLVPARPGPTTLPAEILLDILSRLDAKSVRAASKVCRRWGAIAVDPSIMRSVFKDLAPWSPGLPAFDGNLLDVHEWIERHFYFAHRTGSGQTRSPGRRWRPKPRTEHKNRPAHDAVMVAALAFLVGPADELGVADRSLALHWLFESFHDEWTDSTVAATCKLAGHPLQQHQRYNYCPQCSHVHEADTFSAFHAAHLHVRHTPVFERVLAVLHEAYPQCVVDFGPRYDKLGARWVSIEVIDFRLPVHTIAACREPTLSTCNVVQKLLRVEYPTLAERRRRLDPVHHRRLPSSEVPLQRVLLQQIVGAAAVAPPNVHSVELFRAGAAVGAIGAEDLRWATELLDTLCAQRRYAASEHMVSLVSAALELLASLGPPDADHPWHERNSRYRPTPLEGLFEWRTLRKQQLGLNKYSVEIVRLLVAYMPSLARPRSNKMAALHDLCMRKPMTAASGEIGLLLLELAPKAATVKLENGRLPFDFVRSVLRKRSSPPAQLEAFRDRLAEITYPPIRIPGAATSQSPPADKTPKPAETPRAVRERPLRRKSNSPPPTARAPEPEPAPTPPADRGRRGGVLSPTVAWEAHRAEAERRRKELSEKPRAPRHWR